MLRLKNTLIAFGFCAYNLIFSAGNIFGDELNVKSPQEYSSKQNLATDYRPLFNLRILPNLYPPITGEEKLERMLIEKDALEKMKLKDLNNPPSIMTYPILELKFRVPFLE